MGDYELKIHDQLRQFTLFQGMSYADLMEVVAHTRFDFRKLVANHRLVSEGDECKHLIFLVSGSVLSSTHSSDGQCRVEEVIKAPFVLQPEMLFGGNRRYTATFRTLSAVSYFRLDREEVMLLLETQVRFRMNVLHMFATETQRLHNSVWRTAPRSLRDRIVRFFFSRCMYPAGQKTFYIKMSQLGLLLNDSRLDVSHALNSLQDDGFVTLHRGRIEIPMLERLLM